MLVKLKNRPIYNSYTKTFNTYYAIGQRAFETRIREHNQPSKESAIYDHCITCNLYQTELKNIDGKNPTPKQKIEFIYQFLNGLCKGGSHCSNISNENAGNISYFTFIKKG